ncbi:uncharacterized protein LOC141909768 [Tubulanus polymorphus]|uniref:uncharacterized protein LOC141909768 n=1 Tax=Tubulanus polymorphus TaxID=672921 RepID=UPI003DA548E5
MFTRGVFCILIVCQSVSMTANRTNNTTTIESRTTVGPVTSDTVSSLRPVVVRTTANASATTPVPTTPLPAAPVTKTKVNVDSVLRKLRVTYPDASTCSDELMRCRLTIDDKQNQVLKFRRFRKDHSHVVKFRLSGLNVSIESLAAVDKTTFNPFWWSWVSSAGQFVLNMPVDYHLLSLGLLSLRIEEQTLNISSRPSSCESKLGPKCFNLMIHRLLRRFTRKPNTFHTVPNVTFDLGSDDFICRSAFTHTWLTGETVGIGLDCCLEGVLDDSSSLCPAHMTSRSYRAKRLVLFFCGVLLPIFAIVMAIAWPSFHPWKFTEVLTAEFTNRRIKFDHFRVEPEPTGGLLSDAYILTNPDELMSYSTPVSLTMFMQLPNINRKKLRVTLLILCQYIFIITTVVLYHSGSVAYGYTTKQLDTTEKIVFNLLNIPIAWIYTRSDLWPFKVGVLMIVLVAISTMLLICWWLFESSTIRKFTLRWIKNAFLHENVVHKLPSIERFLHNLLVFALVVVVIGTYPIVFTLFHIPVYVVSGIVINVDIVAPYLTGSAIFFYYAHRAFGKLSKRYTEIQRYVFEYCLSGGEIGQYRAHHVTTSQLIHHDRSKKTMTDVDNVKFTYRWLKIERRHKLIFYYDDAIPHINSNICLKLCKVLYPFRENMARALIRQMANTLFIVLIMLTIIIISPERDEVNTMVTSMVTLFAALLPQLAEIFNNEQVEQLRSESLRHRVYQKLNHYCSEFRVAQKKICASDVLDSLSIAETEVVPERANQTCTHSGAFELETFRMTVHDRQEERRRSALDSIAENTTSFMAESPEPIDPLMMRLSLDSGDLQRID